MHVGKYELIRKLATGGMAEVFLAKVRGPRGFEKVVVVKRILPHLAEDPQFIEMFLTEAQIAARLDHPNVVQIFDFGDSDGEYFLAMEYIDGPDLLSLASCAEQLGVPMPLPVAAKIVALACEGLAYAHELVDAESGEWLKIVHRDMSSDNILVSRNGSVKVVDFGIAKAASQVHKTQTGFIKGKIAYMSREQLLNKPLDARTDVYALGVVLYELVTGTHPYQADSDISLMQAIIREPPTPVSSHRPDLPESLRWVIDKAIAKERIARYASCREMQADLEQFILESGKPVGGSHVAQLVAEVESRLGSRIGARTAPRNLAAVRRAESPSPRSAAGSAGQTQEAFEPTLPSVRRAGSDKTTVVAFTPTEKPDQTEAGGDPAERSPIHRSGVLGRRLLIGAAVVGALAAGVAAGFMIRHVPAAVAKNVERNGLTRRGALADSPTPNGDSRGVPPPYQSNSEEGRAPEETMSAQRAQTAEHQGASATEQQRADGTQHQGADATEQQRADETQHQGADATEQQRSDTVQQKRADATGRQRAEKLRRQRAAKKVQRRAIKKAQQSAELAGRVRGDTRGSGRQPVVASALMLKDALLVDLGGADTRTPVVIPSGPRPGAAQDANLSAIQRSLMQRCDRIQERVGSLDRPAPALLEKLARVREDVPRADTKHEQNALAAALDVLENQVPERSAGTDTASKTPPPINCVAEMSAECTRLHERLAQLRSRFESRNPPSRALALSRLLHIRSKIQTMSTPAEAPGITSDLDAWEREFVGGR